MKKMEHIIIKYLVHEPGKACTALDTSRAVLADMKSKLLLSYEMQRLWSVLHIVQMTHASACQEKSRDSKRDREEDSMCVYKPSQRLKATAI